MTRHQIDTLRGLACVLLVFYHLVGNDPSTGLKISEGALRSFNDGLAYLRMPLFTVLSGLVYGLRPFSGSSPKFLSGKARRLLVPMLVVGTIFALLQWAVPGTNAQDYDWQLLHIEPVGHFWFIESLFWVFFWIWTLECFQWLSHGRGFTLVFASGIILYLTVPGPNWLSIDGAIYLLPYFLAGLAVTRFSWKEFLTHHLVQALLLTLALLAVTQMGWPVANPDRRTVWMLLAGLSLCGFFLGLQLSWQWLARIGTYSYAIYLFHVFFTAAARISLNKMGISTIAVHAAAGLLLGLGGPILVDVVASRNHLTALLLLGKSLKRPAKIPLSTVNVSAQS